VVAALVLEGVSSGVPMACWPFFGDQTMNARSVAIKREQLKLLNQCSSNSIRLMIILLTVVDVLRLVMIDWIFECIWLEWRTK
jgi:hypothetical protein